MRLRSMLYLKLDNILEQLKKFFQKTPEIEEVYIFGSVAKNNHLPWSDIDLLILSNAPEKMRIQVNTFLNELFVRESILICAIIENLEKMSITSRYFKQEGKLLWAKRKNS